MTDVKDIFTFLNNKFPFETQEDFDNSGHLLGDAERVVKKALITLDITSEVVTEAEIDGVALIISHHPVIFHPLKKVMTDDVVYSLVQKGISVISAHTNLDKGVGGVNDVLADKLNLQGAEVYSNSDETGRIGSLPCEMTPDEFAVYVKKQLDANGLRYVAGGTAIRKVAVFGGGGDSFMDSAIAAGADAFVTGEARHHHFMAAKHLGFTFVDAGHFYTENPICPALCKTLQDEFPEVSFKVACQKNPVIILGE